MYCTNSPLVVSAKSLVARDLVGVVLGGSRPLHLSQYSVFRVKSTKSVGVKYTSVCI